MSKTVFRLMGNSTGAIFKKQVVETSGFKRDEVLHVEAEPGRIVITRADSDYDEAMDLVRESFVRYRGAYEKLAK